MRPVLSVVRDFVCHLVRTTYVGGFEESKEEGEDADGKGEEGALLSAMILNEIAFINADEGGLCDAQLRFYVCVDAMLNSERILRILARRESRGMPSGDLYCHCLRITVVAHRVFCVAAREFALERLATTESKGRRRFRFPFR